jgi:hypothetical protein
VIFISIKLKTSLRTLGEKSFLIALIKAEYLMGESFSVLKHRWSTRACERALKNGEMKRKLTGNPV